ncbi:MAG: 2-C-methyl-D-erythritol 2,4-cyclodiphosphate synthase [Deltaproteobacteria bacterium]|nr:2-C-methyl-D-erythritol 2,4-cyclodiphosphate synthase [Deltaproteobacteria bacterium]
MRIGYGYDIHRLVQGRKLILGGVTIPFEKGLLGHSDADVLLHALCDALLGAAGLGDMGEYFPDSEPRFEGIASMELLAETFRRVGDKGFAVNNVDATVLAEAPKLGPFRSSMEANIAGALAIEPSAVNVKATTMEGLGAVGQGQAIAAMCVVSLME